MGFPIIRKTCQRCQKVEPGLIWSNPRMYQLDPDIQIALRYSHGWCFDCDSIQHIEDLSPGTSTEAIRRIAGSLRSASPKRRWFSTAWECGSYSRFDDPGSHAREFAAKDWHAMGHLLETEAHWLDFLAIRTAPARCLRCAGHHIQELLAVEEDGERGWVHPICGGIFRSKITGSMKLCPPDKKRIYRPDGVFSHEEPYEQAPLTCPGALD